MWRLSGMGAKMFIKEKLIIKKKMGEKNLCFRKLLL